MPLRCEQVQKFSLPARDEENFELPVANLDKWAGVGGGGGGGFRLAGMYEISDSDEHDGSNDAMNGANEDKCDTYT